MNKYLYERFMSNSQVNAKFIKKQFKKNTKYPYYLRDFSQLMTTLSYPEIETQEAVQW